MQLNVDYTKYMRAVGVVYQCPDATPGLVNRVIPRAKLYSEVDEGWPVC